MLFQGEDNMVQYTYLNKNRSNAIKGLLIIIIVLGHNHILAPGTTVHGMRDYLYQFHVQAFFILPFFYQKKFEVSWKHICDVLVRNWVPYFWVCLLCYVTLSFTNHHFNFSWGYVMAFINGTQSPLKHYFGFVFPWFLPTYCSLYILFLLASKYRWFYWVLLVLSLFTWTMTWADYYVLKTTIPFGIGLALGFFAYGVITFHLNKYSYTIKYVGLLIFIFLTVGYWVDMSIPYTEHMFPISFFLSVLCIAPCLNCKWLCLLGENSLGIYMFHVFFVNLYCLIFPENLVNGLISFVVSLIISLVITLIINRYDITKHLCFPRSWRDICNLKK
ncbi:acyltransferase family protein [Bacteroides difficilis]|uniref:acyltransferase family protein n=1 Tax=Bacteroides difficilis TaxID=2763021 RepID=UPI003AAE1F1E